MEDIQKFTGEQFNPKRFVVRERYKFCADLKQKVGETIQELASKTWHDAVMCDFHLIKDPLDEVLTLRTRFICSVDNEAVLKSLLRLKDDELTFVKAIQVFQETKEAARVTKETVYGTTFKPVHKVGQPRSKANPLRTGSRDTCNQFTGPKESGTQGSGACDSWIQSRVRRSIPPLYQQVKPCGHSQFRD